MVVAVKGKSAKGGHEFEVEEICFAGLAPQQKLKKSISLYSIQTSTTIATSTIFKTKICGAAFRTKSWRHKPKSIGTSNVCGFCDW